MTDFWRKLESRSHSNLYFALALLPAKKREAFRDVYRFLRAADDVVDSDLPEGEIRGQLTWWRNELDAIYTGMTIQPATQRLSASIHALGLSKTHFSTILDALEADISRTSFRTRTELEAWCEAVSASLAHLCIEILELSGDVVRAYAHDVGVALQLANILRDVAEDARRNKVYLPIDTLQAAGCSIEDVRACRYTPEFAVAAKALAERIRELIRGARSRLTPSERFGLLVPQVWADVYLALLDELETQRFDVFSRRPYLSRSRKLLVATKRVAREKGKSLAHFAFSESV